MGFWTRYHSRRIGALTREHPNVSRDVIERDYYNCLENKGFISAVSRGEIDLDYGIDVISSVDLSLPAIAERGIYLLLRTLLDE